MRFVMGQGSAGMQYRGLSGEQEMMNPLFMADTALLPELRGLIEQTRQHVAQAANSTLTML